MHELTVTQARDLSFSIRRVLILTALAALMLVPFIVPWELLSDFLLMTLYLLFGLLLACVVPVICTVGIVYGRSRLRTFFIGVMFPAAISVLGNTTVLLTNGFWQSRRPGDTLNWLILTNIMAIISGVLLGVLAMTVRRWVERWNLQQHPVPDTMVERLQHRMQEYKP